MEKTTSRSGSEAGGSHENEAKVSKVMEANDVDSENTAMVKYAFTHTYGNVTRNFYEIGGFTVSVICSFSAASSRISAELSKVVRRIVKGCLRICRRASAQSQLSKASTELYCILRIVKG